ncbi:acyl-CoA dehydrogenase [Streptomyces sp. NPDC019531]|uniref:acyl-CoA dehydrogenase n=1 Tax=Streptomyces sp. NPDC019531 TaxID=3365062 RepID=UPI00384E83FD
MVSTPALQRVAALEQRLGDPFDPDNPLGYGAVLDADEQGDTFKAGEDALTEFGMNAELVPRTWGGRFSRLDDLIAVGRVASRRDPGLGAGYVTSSLLAGVCVWLAGNDDQRRHIADTLLAGHRLACAYHELDHGSDFAAVDFSARPAGDRLVLDGRKEVIANVSRARALVLFAATGELRAGQTHSQLLLRHEDLIGERVTHLPRFGTVGLRGVHLGGISFDAAPVDAARVLGEPGRGAENTMKAFQLTRIALPAMMTPVLDTALRCTVRHLRGRTLYGGPAIEMPHLKSKLVDAFVALLAADAFSTAAARTLHVHPGEGPVQASAVKYLLPTLLVDAMNQLATALGAHSYVAEGPTAVFPKLLRDIQAISVVHISKAACRMTLLPQMPLLARRFRRTAQPSHEALFALDADLPPLDFARLRVTGDGQDHLFGGLRAGLAALDEERGQEAELIRPLADALAAEAQRLSDRCAHLPASELGSGASPSTARLVDRYVRLALAGACLETWRHNRRSGTSWMPAWLVAALTRIAGCSAGRLPDQIENRLFAELLARCDGGRDLGWTAHPVFGT